VPWHCPGGVAQTTSRPTVQTPDWQLSLSVQPFPSKSQAVPSGWMTLLQLPSVGSHVPEVWQLSSATHDFGTDPMQFASASQVHFCRHLSAPGTHTLPADFFV
jgi:hypothetical protein